MNAPSASGPAPDPRHAIPSTCEVLVVGGGINGCGIARDLAGRGVRVLLCEQDDLASHTSSASTKLVHGGLRYLEQGHFGLVRKALAERERLLRSAPHIMRPLDFVMPHDPALRPAWLVRAGLLLYDRLTRRDMLPASRRLDLRRHSAGRLLQPRWTTGFAYADGWVDDARLVALCAVDAAARGARVLTRARCERVRRGAAGWTATLRGEDGVPHRLEARALVNATGPWAGAFLREQAGMTHPPALRLVRGSHIVVRRRFGDHAWLLPTTDRRVVFALPYEGDFTLVGTTEVEHRGPPGEATVDAAEIDYLCAQANRFLAEPIDPADVAWSYAGVRPLLAEDAAADASALTRDYQLELDTAGGAPLLSVWGGKITTFRRLAEEAADLLVKGPLAATLPAAAQDGIPRRGAWTAEAKLPGGDLSAWIGPPGRRPDEDFARFERVLGERHPALPAALRHDWARRYGSRIGMLLDGGSPGTEIAPGVFEAELAYLRDHEFARRIEDVLWRRTKHGLHLDDAGHARAAAWWAAHGSEARC